MAKYDFIGIDSKSFQLKQGNYDTRYSAVCSIRASEDYIFVQSRYTSAVVIEKVLFSDISVNGVTYGTVDETCTALDAVVNFNSAGGGGSPAGAETDPVAMAKIATYFDENGQLRTTALPSMTGVPTELLSAAPTSPVADTLYVFPNGSGVYQMQFWDGTAWNVIGDFGADFNIDNYPTTDDLNAALANYASITALNGKRDATTSAMVVYTTDTNGGQNSIPYATQATANTIPVRSTNGSIAVGNNVSGNNAVGAIQVQSMIDSAGNNYQATLTAGDNITIDSNNVISATVGGGGVDTETDPVAMPILTQHIATDQGRWADYYATKIKAVQTAEVVAGKKIDLSQLQIIAMPSASQQVTIPKQNGDALVAAVFTNQNGNFTTITDSNGKQYYSSEGLADHVQFTYVDIIPLSVTLDTVVTITNSQSIEVIIYLNDPDSFTIKEIQHAVIDNAYETDVNTPIDKVTGKALVTETEFTFDVNKLSNHIGTDINRWNNVYTFEGEIIDSVVNAKGMKRDIANNVTFNTVYTATNNLGGVLTVTVQNSDAVPSQTVSINNVKVYDSKGLENGVPVTIYFPIKDNDLISVNGVQSATFTPYIADPASSQQQLLLTINTLTQRIGDLQQQINDTQAAVNNKTIANVTPIDITNTSYTVNNALGARITGQGSQVLGLLGITVASTGTVSVNGTQVYNNTALLSGTPEILSINVDDRAVISSSGMSYVDVYLYVTA